MRERCWHQIFRGSLGILVGVIVKSLIRLDLDHRQHPIADHAHGQFLSRHQFLDKNLLTVKETVRKGLIDSSRLMDEMNADTRPLARGLDDDGQGKRGMFARTQDLVTGSRHAGFHQSLLSQDLVKGHTTLRGPLTRVSNTMFVEHLLETSILAEGSMDQVEDKFGPVWNNNLGASNLNLLDVGTGVPERCGH